MTEMGFSTPPELMRTPPRPVRLSGWGKVAAVAAALLILAALLIGPWLYAEATRGAARLERIESEGVTTRAEVTAIGRSRGKEGRRDVSYQFEAGGRVHNGRTSVQRNAARRLAVGSAVEVRYMPADPEQNWMRGREPRGVPMVVVPLVPVLLALGALPIIYSIRKQRRLLAEGRAAPAHVTGVRRVQQGNHRVHRVDFEYRVLSGAVRKGHFDVQRKPPAVGSVLTVIYDPDQPNRHARYPLALVRVDAY